MEILEERMVPSIVNGSFETGDYTGWTLFESSDAPPNAGTWGLAADGQTIQSGESTFDYHDGISVSQNSPGLPKTYSAADGNYLAYQLQNGPQCHRLFQDVTLPGDAETLSWSMSYTNHAIGFDDNQYVAVRLRNQLDVVLQTLFITNPGDANDLAMTQFSRDISAFAGQTVRLEVEMDVRDFHLDAAFDNFVVKTESLPPPPPAPDYLVNTTSDHDDGSCQSLGSGDCTLREAINAANFTPGLELIAFDIPGQGPHTIRPNFELPQITGAVTIDGTTEPDYSAMPVIELDGSNIGSLADGLLISAGSSTVRGLTINRFSRCGVSIRGSGGSVIEGNFIGTDSNGSVALGNGIHPVNGCGGVQVVDSSNNRIGGTTPGSGNLISGNNGPGVRVGASFPDILVSGNTVQGNLIGTDVTGTVAIANAMGINVHSAPDTLIGSATGSSPNLISGNSFEGLFIVNSPRTTVQGNFFGTDISGTAPLPNGSFGIDAESDNVIGGTESGMGNTVAFNRGGGVRLDGLQSAILGNSIFSNDGPGIWILGGSANVIRGNRVTTNAATGIDILSSSANTVGGMGAGEGNYVDGNFASGVRVSGSSQSNSILGNTIISNGGNGVWIESSLLNSVGGIDPGAGNRIALNALNGVRVDRNATRTVILGNSIAANARLGIDLIPEGVTANDLFDSDTGANNVQNFPTLTTAFSSGDTTTIDGVLHSVPNTAFRIEFFSNGEADGSGFGEGDLFLGWHEVVTNGTGNAHFSVTLAVPTKAGQFITATATDPASNTSEFSTAVEVAPQGPPATPIAPIANAGGLYIVSEGESIQLDASLTTDPDQLDNTTLD